MLSPVRLDIKQRPPELQGVGCKVLICVQFCRSKLFGYISYADRNVLIAAASGMFPHLTSLYRQQS